MRFFFHIAYCGTNYHGWQRQPDVPTVQETIETTLTELLKTAITAVGCGRTDAGVHASQYFFHIDSKDEIDTDPFQLNKLLPDDISVYDIIPVDDNNHAQQDAVERVYEYLLHTQKDPFISEQSALYLDEQIDLDKMREASYILLNYTDYRAFCVTPDRQDSTIVNINYAEWKSSEQGDHLHFTISADRFLRGMVRVIVGQLLEVGMGRLSVEQFEEHLSSKTAPKLLNQAWPQGLYLAQVRYPFFEE